MENSHCQDCSFDIAGVFQTRSTADDLPPFYEPDVDEQELLKAARSELKHVKKSRLSRAGKSQIAATILQTHIGGASFAEHLAEIIKQRKGGFPTVEIEYKDLTIEADALIGSAANPTVWNSFKSLANRLVLRSSLPTRPLTLLDSVSGVIKPGRLTLLLGPPGSGKSVLLQSLSGRLRLHKELRQSGVVTYNGETMDKFVVQRTAGLVDQYDYHIPNLTVAETVKFAGECQTGKDFQLATLVAVDKAAAVARKKAQEDAFASALEEGGAYPPSSFDKGSAPTNQSASVSTQTPSATPTGTATGTDTSAEGLLDANAKAEYFELMREAVLYRVKPYITIQLMGLAHCADTFVCNESLRGISGGERKRVTTAEVLAGPQWAVFMDEISTGLDSATTFSVVTSLKEACHALSRTVVISLLQPPPEVMALFDDLLLITDGKVMYHGPVDEATQFFADLGFVCPPRKDTASFLQEVTTPLGQFTYATEQTLDEFKVPAQLRDPAKLLVKQPKKLLVPVDAIAEAFWTGKRGMEMRAQLERHAAHPEPTGNELALARTHYARSGGRLSLLALKRQMTLVVRDKSYYIARSVQAVIMGLIIASLFASVAPPATTDPDYANAIFKQGRKALSLLVFSTIYLSMSSMPSLGFVFITKRVFYKHRDNHFFPSWSYVVSLAISQVPASTAESILYALVVYFISGLTRTVSCFFIFLLVTWSASNSLASLFRLIAYFTPSMVIANATGALILLFMMITNGFSIIRTSIPAYLIWIYWGLNPLSYAIRALAVNELTTPAWGQAGEQILTSFGLYTETYWIWIGVGFQWAFLVLTTVLGSFALMFTNPPTVKPSVPVEEQKEEVTRELSSYIARCMVASREGTGVGGSVGSGTVPVLAPNFSADLGSRTLSAESNVVPLGGDGDGVPSVAPGVASLTEADVEAAADTAVAAAEEEEEEAAEAVVVPFVPITLVCRDVCYYVNDPSGGTSPGVVKDTADKELHAKPQLLNNIDFYASPGELVALMGGSGAGTVCFWFFLFIHICTNILYCIA